MRETERERERERKRKKKIEKGGGQKRLRRNKGRHSKINKKCPCQTLSHSSGVLWLCCGPRVLGRRVNHSSENPVSHHWKLLLV